MWDVRFAIKTFLLVMPYPKSVISYLTVSSSLSTCLLSTWLTPVQERAHYNKIASAQQLSKSDQMLATVG